MPLTKEILEAARELGAVLRQTPSVQAYLESKALYEDNQQNLELPPRNTLLIHMQRDSNLRDVQFTYAGAADTINSMLSINFANLADESKSPTA